MDRRTKPGGKIYQESWTLLQTMVSWIYILAVILNTRKHRTST